MLPFHQQELQLALNLLNWLDDNRQQFAEVLAFPSEHGADPADDNQWGMLLLDLIGEKIGLSACVGSLASWDKAMIETKAECDAECDHDGWRKMDTLDTLVYALLSEVP